MIRNAFLSIPIGSEILKVACGISYDEDRGVYIGDVLELSLCHMNYNTFQELFKLKYANEDGESKYFFDLRIGQEWIILCDVVIEELLRDRVVLRIGRAVINEV